MIYIFELHPQRRFRIDEHGTHLDWIDTKKSSHTLNMIDKAKTDYYSTVIYSNKNNSKELWGYMNEIAPKEKK